MAELFYFEARAVVSHRDRVHASETQLIPVVAQFQCFGPALMQHLARLVSKHLPTYIELSRAIGFK